jgi:WD40 repeat protein
MAPAVMARDPPRRRSGQLKHLTFVNSYNVVNPDENPLVTGEVEDSGGRSPAKTGAQQLQLSLHELVYARRAFERDETGEPNAELTLAQFETSLGPLVGGDMQEQLRYLFMKIDCNCDGRVSWDELLTFVMSQERNEHRPLLQESRLVRADIRECPDEEMHREPATVAIYVPKSAVYVSGGRDSSLRIWSTKLRMQHKLPVSPTTKPVTVQSMTLLPSSLNKLVVGGSDRVLSFYELQDSAGSKRWSVCGRVQLNDMAISLASWAHVADDALCLAIGTDAGSVPIFDAKKLLSFLKGEDMRGKVNKYGVAPFMEVESALIVTLPVHTDWVCQMAYEASLAALVSGSNDSTLKVTQLDWPPSAVPSAASTLSLKAEAVEPARADPAHCRNMCTIRAHHKGVISFQLMNVSSRKLCATCSHERDACVWNIETGDLMRTLVGHRALLRQVAFDSTSQMLITLSVDGEMRTWEMISYSQVQTIRSPGSSPSTCIASVQYNAALECLVTTTCCLSIWQHPQKTATEEVLNASLLSPQGHRNALVSVLFSDQFNLVISGDEAGVVSRPFSTTAGLWIRGSQFRSNRMPADLRVGCAQWTTAVSV